MQKAVGSGDTAALPAMGQTCLLPPETHSIQEAFGAAVKRLFVLTLGLCLAIFGRLPIGCRWTTATPTSAVAAQQLLTFPAQILRNWCSHWAKITMLICWIET